MARLGPLLAASIAIALSGCAREETIELHRWTLHAIDGAETAEVAVTVPAHLDRLLPARPCVYSLSTRVSLPDILRGRSLTLAIPSLEAPTALRIRGQTVPSLEQNVAPGHPSLSAQSFHIDGAHTASAQLALDLIVDRRSTRGAWLDTVPRLSATPFGDRTFLAVRALNGSVVLAAFAVTSTIGFTYLALYFFELRRRVHLWYAVQAMGVSYYLIERLGIPQSLLGWYDFSAWAVVASSVAGVYFTRAYFGLPKPKKIVPALLLVFLFVIAVSAGPFHGPVLAIAAASIVLAFIGYQVVLLIGQLRAGRDPGSAAVMLGAWLVTAIACPPDVAYLAGFGQIAGGAQTLVLGLGLFSVLQAVVLGRDHARSLRESDSLNIALQERVAMLEARDRENSLLSDELRRQIADRSRQLADALARIGVVPQRDVSLAPGAIVQRRYRVVRRIGEGGMGAVYEVERITDGRRLALKVLTAAKSGVALARLAREAQIAAEVSHENLVSIVDVDVSEEGALYLVMELVEGAPLCESRDRYGDTAWARAILRQIAHGLVALHVRGVVHRDLKPANVLLTREGVAKIADFGIARISSPETPDPDAPTLASPTPSDAVRAPTRERAGANLTATGAFMGTPMYMAPELSRGARSALPSSDLFSFGVIAYEISTGRLPFPTPAVLIALAGQELVATPPAGGDARFSALIMRCLAADPSARPTAAEIAHALREST